MCARVYSQTVPKSTGLTHGWPVDAHNTRSCTCSCSAHARLIISSLFLRLRTQRVACTLHAGVQSAPPSRRPIHIQPSPADGGYGKQLRVLQWCVLHVQVSKVNNRQRIGRDRKKKSRHGQENMWSPTRLGRLLIHLLIEIKVVCFFSHASVTQVSWGSLETRAVLEGRSSLVPCASSLIMAFRTPEWTFFGTPL